LYEKLVWIDVPSISFSVKTCAIAWERYSCWYCDLFYGGISCCCCRVQKVGW